MQFMAFLRDNYLPQTELIYFFKQVRKLYWEENNAINVCRSNLTIRFFMTVNDSGNISVFSSKDAAHQIHRGRLFIYVNILACLKTAIHPPFHLFPIRQKLTTIAKLNGPLIKILPSS